MITIQAMNLMGGPQAIDFTTAATTVVGVLLGVMVAGLAIMFAGARVGRGRHGTVPPPATAMPYRPARHAA